jgi:Putative phage metallopeptidase
MNKEQALNDAKLKEATVTDYMDLSDLVEVEFPDLARINIQIKMFIWKKVKSSKGREILGQISVCPLVQKALHGVDAIIFLSPSYPSYPQKKKEALLYHELSHLYVDEDGKLLTVDHDLMEFYSVYKKYGDWKNEFATAQHAMTLYQLELSLEAE